MMSSLSLWGISSYPTYTWCRNPSQDSEGRDKLGSRLPIASQTFSIRDISEDFGRPESRLTSTPSKRCRMTLAMRSLAEKQRFAGCEDMEKEGPPRYVCCRSSKEDQG